MSHNSLKIGSATQAVTGELSPALNDLSDVSGSPVTGQVLSFSGSAWSPAAASSGIKRVCFTSWTSAGGFSTSTANYDVNDNVIWRSAQLRINDLTYVTRTTALTGSRVPANSNSWTQYWTLKASALSGKSLRFEAVHQAKDLTGSEYIRYQWGIGSSDLATFTPIGNIAEQTANYTQAALGHYIMGASDINLALKVVNKSGVMGILTNAQSRMSHLTFSILAE